MTRRAKPISRNHEAATIDSFRRNPELAVEYLNAVLAEADQDELMVALRRVAKAFGGVARLARGAELNATTLYRTLSRDGNPELRSLVALLRALGMQLAVRRLPRKRAA